MFTGIIKAKGTVVALQERGGDVRMTLRADGLPWADYDVGESIAVNGVCLTAVGFHDDGFDADVSLETLRVTSLGELTAGSPVNLEPSLSIGERLGGHLVSGHVDCVGTVTTRTADARSIRLLVEIADDFSRYVAKKGSICIDGVSLTVNEVSGASFAINIIPHTADATIIRDYRVGTHVNVEVDQLARYLERLITQDGDDISLEFLKVHGYA
jgi:riboflavin synthase